jgi:IS30 family transposase
MSYAGRPGYTASQNKELWDLYRTGESISAIGLALGKHPSSIHHILNLKGGFTPPMRVRSERSLCLTEREEISRGMASGQSIRAIARQINRSASTVSREIERNGGHRRYRASGAEDRAIKQLRRPKLCLLATQPKLNRIVATKLAKWWSPQQVAGWLKVTYPGNPNMNVSHETIYRSLFIQARGVLKKELVYHLRTRRMMRHSKDYSRKHQNSGGIKDAVSFRERPAEVEDRAVPGHWEGDLICGSRQSYIATLVERQSRYVVLVKVNGKDTNNVVGALIKAVKRLPEGLMSTLTWDRGTELASHQRFSVATNVDVFFCEPRSPWQRGTNENTNGLLRQYFPNETDLSLHSQAALNRVAREMNTRPRKTLDFATPAATLDAAVAMTR